MEDTNWLREHRDFICEECLLKQMLSYERRGATKILIVTEQHDGGCSRFHLAGTRHYTSLDVLPIVVLKPVQV